MNLARIRLLVNRVQRLLEAGYGLADAIDTATSGETLTAEEWVALEVHVDLTLDRTGGARTFLN